MLYEVITIVDQFPDKKNDVKSNNQNNGCEQTVKIHGSFPPAAGASPDIGSCTTHALADLLRKRGFFSRFHCHPALKEIRPCLLCQDTAGSVFLFLAEKGT